MFFLKDANFWESIMKKIYIALNSLITNVLNIDA